MMPAISIYRRVIGNSIRFNMNGYPLGFDMTSVKATIDLCGLAYDESIIDDLQVMESEAVAKITEIIKANKGT